MATAVGELASAIGELPRHWWVVALRGLAAIVFGILAFIWPGVTLSVLVLLFGAYAIVDGVLALYTAVRSDGKQIWAPLLEGVVGIAAGLVAFFLPGLTAPNRVTRHGAARRAHRVECPPRVTRESSGQRPLASPPVARVGHTPR